MARLVLILGRSGSGKSASLRNFEDSEYALINVMGKDLPFKSSKKFLESTNYANIKQALLDYTQKVDIVVLDDSGYLITEQFMTNHSGGKGNAIFELYNSLADNFYRLIRFIKNDLPQDKTIYLTMHEDRDEFGYVKPKTIGKMLDEKVNIAGMFSIILHAIKQDGAYVFRTQTDGFDVTKSPIGMFEEEFIENDLKLVNQKIKDYYNKGE
jgi:hypothetical protein